MATPGPVLDLESRVAVCGGAALYLISSAIRLTPGSLPRSAVVARLIVVALALVLVGAGPGPPALVGLLALATVGLTISEARRAVGGRTSEGP